MRILLTLSLVAAAACRPPPRWMVVEVRSAGAPVAGATVAAVCPPFASEARVTGDDGRVELAFEQKVKSSCVVTAEREGLRTERAPNVTVCRDRGTCAPVQIDLEAP